VRRLIANIRLSRDTDTTNAPATQRADITDWVAEHPGNRIDYWTEDLDVSGGIPIAERPGIGPFLAEDRLDEWDGIIGKALDRLFRDQLDYLLWVRDIGEKYGKFVIDAEDGTDSSTRVGRDTLNDRARTAQRERERTSERRARAGRQIRQEARYGGGLILFGLKQERYEVGREDGKPAYALRLVEHGPHADEARSIVKRILAGESANSIANDLNTRGVPTSRDAMRIIAGGEPRGGKWTAANLLRYLRSPALKGYVLHYPNKNGRGTRSPSIVYGPDGFPVRRVALIDDETWDELQAVIRKAGEGRTTGRRVNATSLLLGVAHCGECGGRLHSEPKIKRGVRCHYYGCQNTHNRGCRARLIPRDELDNIVNAAIAEIADRPVIEIKRGHGNERERKLKEIGEAIVDLTTDRYMRGIIRPNYDDLLASLQAEESRIRTTPSEPSEEKQVPTGETIGQLWQRLDTQGRRVYLLGTGLKLLATRDANDQIHIKIEKGEQARYVNLSLAL
jgi:DNA invertase Pin-like site-specific DNA recombinase